MSGEVFVRNPLSNYKDETRRREKESDLICMPLIQVLGANVKYIICRKSTVAMHLLVATFLNGSLVSNYDSDFILVNKTVVPYDYDMW